MIFAYVDPSVMSYTVQAVAGVAVALGVVFSVVWRRIKRGARRALGRSDAEKKIKEEAVRIID